MVKTISEILSEKIVQYFSPDGFAERLALTRLGGVIPEDDPLAMFVYHKFLHRFGLPSISDVNMVAFALSLEQYRGESIRVNTFAKFAFGEGSSRVRTVVINQ